MANFAQHGTLTPNVVTTVNLVYADDTVEVVNRTGTAEIWFTVGRSNAPPDPVIGADDTFIVPAMVGSYVMATRSMGSEGYPRMSEAGPRSSIVKLLSSGAMAYSVLGGQP